MTASTPNSTYTWFAPEAEHMDISLAVREYIQNQVGQVLKETQSLQWCDWKHVNIDNTNDADKRRKLKAHIIRSYPGLLTGPHGARVRLDSNEWLPVYVLSAKVALEKLIKTQYTTDLDICNVVWRNTNSNLVALTFLNNHLDQDAAFSTFVTQGESTNRESLWAAGQNGAGFMIATQFFYELVDDLQKSSSPSEDISQCGISFRVGYNIGELGWDARRCPSCPARIAVKLDDLTPLTPEEVALSRGITEKDAAIEVTSMSRRRLAYNMSNPKGIVKSEKDRHQALFSEEYTIREDEVSITVIGLSGDITPEHIFCGTYGLFKPTRSWRIPNALFEFFQTPKDVSLFYYRGQLMPSSQSGLNRLGVNYHGTLQTTSARTQVARDPILYQRYRHLLTEAIQYAFCHIPELAVELAADILADSDSECKERALDIFEPKTGSEIVYKVAFNSAWRRLDSNIPLGEALYPYHKSSVNDSHLIEEFGMFAVPVRDDIMDQVLIPSGAFIPIREHAEDIFLHRKGVGSGITGFTQYRRALLEVFSWAASSDIVMVDYTNSYPKVLWDNKTRQFVVGVPRCAQHSEEECSCWIGPYLMEARETYRKYATEATDMKSLTFAALFRGYAIAMGGDVDQIDRKGKASTYLRKRKNPPDSQVFEKPEPPISKRPRAQLTRTVSNSLACPDSDMEVENTGEDVTTSTVCAVGGKVVSAAALRASMLVEPTIIHAELSAGFAHSSVAHPLTEHFKGIMEAYDRTAVSASTQAARFEMQRQHLLSESLKNEETIKDLQSQISAERTRGESLRTQLQVVESERDRTRELLVAKWTENKQG
ncbi:hypothetical protein BJ138DRAFT_1175042 [Hygrophoropsis aurantiaca]|uniref:Uncharacterized protein n=1 Tax=Hygrophoropsis aurantiaca TaxID=72124 RepID=A0ACB7ZZP5_9AGAM|nr:hypothetical protein BJ138DRAFT_1175042 [Hygrophoropsis aurantiaca]